MATGTEASGKSKDLLTYLAENFNEAMTEGSVQRKQYLTLDSKFRAALQTQNSAYFAHQTFIKEFEKNHPGFSNYSER